MSVIAERAIALTGSFNVRDLGGLPAAGGQVVRRGRLYRSDYPGFAGATQGAAASEAVGRLGLRTVVDLRRRREVAHECVAWEAFGVTHLRFALSSAAGTDPWRARYPGYLQASPEPVVAAVSALLDGAGHPALFHCAAGKDRTGVIAAILLAVLGVAREDIVADYELSRHGIGAIIDRLRLAEPYAQMLAGTTAEDHHPRHELITELLDLLDQHGGTAAWLTSQGVDPARVVAFRSTMLQVAPRAGGTAPER
jgi:hypothetical protein